MKGALSPTIVSGGISISRSSFSSYLCGLRWWHIQLIDYFEAFSKILVDRTSTIR